MFHTFGDNIELPELRSTRRIAAIVFCALTSSCASVKQMTADFEKKWDDPSSIMQEMDSTSSKIRAADSSVEAMIAYNQADCSAKFGILKEDADETASSVRGLSIGECLLDAGKNGEAAKLFKMIADEAPNATALQGLGVASVRLGRFGDAEAALVAALDLDPELWRAWNALGVTRDHQGRTELAWMAFRRSAEINPADGASLNNLGVSQLKAGLEQEAIESFKLALNLDGAGEAAEANLRLAFAMQGDYASAIKALPDDRRALALNNAGIAAASRGDTAEARQLFLRALEESPHFYAKAYRNLSLLLE
jgi:Flp pilus assembly protein TadD